MNRIILIGNGFDLAHELSTSYKDFINSCWKKIITELRESRNKEYEDNYVKLSTSIDTLAHVFSSKNSVCTLDELKKQITSFNAFKSTNVNFSFKNKFFEHISRNLGLNNWVDIENEYYNFIKSFINPYKYTGYNYASVSLLNEHFDVIKKDLENYLKKIMPVRIGLFDENSGIREIIYSDFKLKDFTEEGAQSMAEKEDFKMPENILFLSFNYTDLDRLYMNDDGLNREEREKDIIKDSIHIHGLLNKKDNPIIFGYGDEIDDEYLEIEKQNKNELLENIKSIKYLETDNYKRLIRFMESDRYQIFILGHSCGNSDRTLLSTLFNNDNCVSIKVYYHKKDDGTDNYSDVIRNISRNFKDKIPMRNKVVNKEYCKPLIGHK